MSVGGYEWYADCVVCTPELSLHAGVFRFSDGSVFVNNRIVKVESAEKKKKIWKIAACKNSYRFVDERNGTDEEKTTCHKRWEMYHIFGINYVCFGILEKEWTESNMGLLKGTLCMHMIRAGLAFPVPWAIGMWAPFFGFRAIEKISLSTTKPKKNVSSFKTQSSWPRIW